MTPDRLQALWTRLDTYANRLTDMTAEDRLKECLDIGDVQELVRLVAAELVAAELRRRSGRG